MHVGIEQSDHGHSEGPSEGAAKKIRPWERKYTHQAAAGRHLQKRVKQRWWLPSKRHRKATEPATVSDDEQLRLDVAAVVVDLSWPWAPLRMALATRHMRP